MTAPLPRLRASLDIFPSPAPDQPGLVLRDPFRYSEIPILVPEGIAPALACFDGRHNAHDLQRVMSQLAARPVANQEVVRFIDTLRTNGFLDGEDFRALRRAKHASFAAAATREAVHAGSGYPLEPKALSATLERYRREGAPSVGPPRGRPIGIAAPHVSPFGGAAAYGSAYNRIPQAGEERVFVILGTSHYGPPDKFGLTKKAFLTPYRPATVDTEAVELLATRASEAVNMEDYAHSIEHSIEFQVVFLQHAVGGPIRIVPILCGPFACSGGELPEDRPGVRSFFQALEALKKERGNSLFWVLGIDLAHMGVRYGDDRPCRSLEGSMNAVKDRDHARLERVCAGDPSGLFELAHVASDDLKWCGTPPLYTFMRAVPEARAQLLRYEQWNIDPQSVVTFAGLELSSEA